MCLPVLFSFGFLCRAERLGRGFKMRMKLEYNKTSLSGLGLCVIMGTQIEGRRSRERPQSDTRCPWISHRSCSSLCWKSRTSERPWRRIAAIAQSPTYHIRDRCPIVLPLCVEFRNFLTFGLHTGGSARGKNGTDLGTRPASRSRNSGRPPPTGLPLQNYFI